MEFKFQKRRGIGNVITTLIILIASVVLGAGVIFFGGSMFQSNTESESIQVSNAHVWVNSTSSQAAFVVQNTGGKVVSISQISIRGTSIPLSKWYYNNTNLSSAEIQTDLVKDNDGNQLAISVNGVSKSFTLATGPVSLAQGQSAIIYLKNPAGLSSTDAGINYTMSVTAGKSNGVLTVPVVTG